MRMRALVLTSLLALSACGTVSTPGQNVPLPATGQIAFTCSNGQQLAVDFQRNAAQVAIVGGPSMVLQGDASAVSYSNGRYTLHRSGNSASWQTPGAAPVNCRGS